MSKVHSVLQRFPVSSYRQHERIVRLVLQYGLWLVFVFVFIGLAVASPFFLTSENLLDIGRQTTAVIIVSVAMTLVISTAGIDLSVGAIITALTTMLAYLLQLGVAGWLVLSAVLLAGASIGLVNGLFIAYQEVPPFVVTLATLTALRGVALIITEGRAIPVRDPLILAFGRQNVLGVPLSIVLAAGAVLLGAFFLRRTQFGVHVLAVGGNEEAARLVGVNVPRVKLTVYGLSGVASGIASLIVAGRVGAGSPSSGVGTELDVITGVIIGGTNLFGGEGTVFGSVLGAFFVAVVGNGLTLLHISPYYAQVITGMILLLAIWLNVRAHKIGTREPAVLHKE
jgi:simple sugar transport system permease protein